MPKLRKASNAMQSGHEKKVKRLLRIYDRLMNGKKIDLKTLAKEFRVSERSLQRDIADMTEVHGLPITAETIGGRRRYTLIEHKDKYPIVFTISDIIVAKLALQMMEHFQGTGLVGYIQQLAQKISDRMNRPIVEDFDKFAKKIHAHQLFKKNYRSKNDQFNEVLSALLYEKKLTIHYQSANAKSPRKLLVRPYTIVTYKTGLYLIALVDNAPQGGRPTTFSLERIKSAKKEQERFDYPSDWNPKQHLPLFGGLLPGKEMSIRIRFDETLHVYIKSLLWPPKTKITKPKKGEFTLQTKLSVSDEIVNWVLGFGRLAKVEGSKAFQTLVKTKLEEALQRYE